MGKIKSEKKARVHEQIKQGLVFNKDFGQHILKNPMVVRDQTAMKAMWRVCAVPKDRRACIFKV